ncbi:chromosome-associated kinesin KIF4A-like [Watersipora subatra]|uniref:chromosome-associated kinesin KIF4A-like n=1 Tax=Watersipora subatra TaxID=2589382 RepID=UPI00355C2FBB
MPAGESSAVRVFAKIRPALPSEAAKLDIKVSGSKLTTPVGGVESSFTFDGIYDADSKTRVAYKEKCEPLLHRVVEGTNVSIVAMGVTGSGKSHFLSGAKEDPGIGQCIINGLFQVIERMKNKEFFVTVQYLEVMDGIMTDLLNPHPGQLKIKSTTTSDVFIEGLSSLVVADATQLLQYYEQGTRARKMGTTETRSHKERSSSVFILNIEQREPGKTNIGLSSCLTLVDLASIESSTCKELVNCINALSQKLSHVPYRESKLSRVLQEILGGNCLTSVFALLTPHGDNNSQTFKISQALQQIKHSVSINVVDTERIVANLREDINSLREKVSENISTKEDVVLLQELVSELEIAKQQTWEGRQRLSLRYEEERKANLANRGILEWVMDSKQKDRQQIQEKILHLQKEKEQLNGEFAKKRQEVIEFKEQLQTQIKDYSKMAESEKTSDADRKSRVEAIHKLKERLQETSDHQKSLKASLQDVQERLRSERADENSKSMTTKGNLPLAWLVEAEERQRIEAEDAAMIAEEIERMKLEVENEKADIKLRLVEGKTYSANEYAELEMRIAELKHEKPITSLEINSLKQQKVRLQAAVDEMHKQHSVEIEKQQLQHFQTFRNYRDMFDKQKMAIDQRYRELLDDAIQDAVFLSSRNNELTNENAELQSEIAKLKDALSLAGGK